MERNTNENATVNPAASVPKTEVVNTRAQKNATNNDNKTEIIQVAKDVGGAPIEYCRIHSEGGDCGFDSCPTRFVDNQVKKIEKRFGSTADVTYTVGVGLPIGQRSLTDDGAVVSSMVPEVHDMSNRICAAKGSVPASVGRAKCHWVHVGGHYKQVCATHEVYGLSIGIEGLWPVEDEHFNLNSREMWSKIAETRARAQYGIDSEGSVVVRPVLNAEKFTRSGKPIKNFQTSRIASDFGGQTIGFMELRPHGSTSQTSLVVERTRFQKLELKDSQGQNPITVLNPKSCSCASGKVDRGAAVKARDSMFNNYWQINTVQQVLKTCCQEIEFQTFSPRVYDDPIEITEWLDDLPPGIILMPIVETDKGFQLHGILKTGDTEFTSAKPTPSCGHAYDEDCKSCRVASEIVLNDLMRSFYHGNTNERDEFVCARCNPRTNASIPEDVILEPDHPLYEDHVRLRYIVNPTEPDKVKHVEYTCELHGGRPKILTPGQYGFIELSDAPVDVVDEFVTYPDQQKVEYDSILVHPNWAANTPHCNSTHRLLRFSKKVTFEKARQLALLALGTPGFEFFDVSQITNSEINGPVDFTGEKWNNPLRVNPPKFNNAKEYLEHVERTNLVVAQTGLSDAQRRAIKVAPMQYPGLDHQGSMLDKYCHLTDHIGGEIDYIRDLHSNIMKTSLNAKDTIEVLKQSYNVASADDLGKSIIKDFTEIPELMSRIDSQAAVAMNLMRRRPKIGREQELNELPGTVQEQFQSLVDIYRGLVMMRNVICTKNIQLQASIEFTRKMESVAFSSTPISGRGKFALAEVQSEIGTYIDRAVRDRIHNDQVISQQQDELIEFQAEGGGTVVESTGSSVDKITNFSQGPSRVVVGREDPRDLTDLTGIASSSKQDYKYLLENPVEIEKISVNTADAEPFRELLNKGLGYDNPVGLIRALDNPARGMESRQKLPFKEHTFFSTDATITVQCNFNRMVSGVGLLYYIPHVDDMPNQAHPCNLLSYDHAFINLPGNSSVSLNVKFQSPLSMLSTDFEYDRARFNLGRFCFVWIVAPSSLDAVTGTVSVFSQLNNAQFSYPRDADGHYESLETKKNDQFRLHYTTFDGVQGVDTYTKSVGGGGGGVSPANAFKRSSTTPPRYVERATSANSKAPPKQRASQKNMEFQAEGIGIAAAAAAAFGVGRKTAGKSLGETAPEVIAATAKVAGGATLTADAPTVTNSMAPFYHGLPSISNTDAPVPTETLSEKASARYLIHQTAAKPGCASIQDLTSHGWIHSIVRIQADDEPNRVLVKFSLNSLLGTHKNAQTPLALAVINQFEFVRFGVDVTIMMAKNVQQSLRVMLSTNYNADQISTDRLSAKRGLSSIVDFDETRSTYSTHIPFVSNRQKMSTYQGARFHDDSHSFGIHSISLANQLNCSAASPSHCDMVVILSLRDVHVERVKTFQTVTFTNREDTLVENRWMPQSPFQAEGGKNSKTARRLALVCDVCKNHPDELCDELHPGSTRKLKEGETVCASERDILALTESSDEETVEVDEKSDSTKIEFQAEGRTWFLCKRCGKEAETECFTDHMKFIKRYVVDDVKHNTRKKNKNGDDHEFQAEGPTPETKENPMVGIEPTENEDVIVVDDIPESSAIASAPIAPATAGLNMGTSMEGEITNMTEVWRRFVEITPSEFDLRTRRVHAKRADGTHVPTDYVVVQLRNKPYFHGMDMFCGWAGALSYELICENPHGSVASFTPLIEDEDIASDLSTNYGVGLELLQQPFSGKYELGLVLGNDYSQSTFISWHGEQVGRAGAAGAMARFSPIASSQAYDLQTREPSDRTISMCRVEIPFYSTYSYQLMPAGPDFISTSPTGAGTGWLCFLARTASDGSLNMQIRQRAGDDFYPVQFRPPVYCKVAEAPTHLNHAEYHPFGWRRST